MRLRSADASQQALAEAHRGLRLALGARRNVDLAFGAGDEGRELATELPHRVFVLDANFMLKDQPLRRARQIGIRYFVHGGLDMPVATVDVATDADGNVVGFERVTRGPHVVRMWNALQLADRLDSGEEAEIRALEVPALYVIALWLAEMGNEPDLLIPLESSGDALTEGTAYTERDFVQALGTLDASRERLQQFPV